MCYILPALMGDELYRYTSFYFDRTKCYHYCYGNCSCFINSLQSPEANSKYSLIRDRAKLVMVSPERLALPSFRNILSRLKIDSVAIDEAHCVNHWGLDFRPEYGRISSY